MATITEELLVIIKSVGAATAAADVARVGTASEVAGKKAKTAADEHLGFRSALGSVKSIAGQVAGIAGVAGLTLGISASIRAAQQMQESMVQLGGAIKNNVRNPAKDAAEQMRGFADTLAVKGGFSPLETIQGLTRLVTETKNVGQAQHLMSLATDISRRAHIGLERAVRAVMMVEAGRTTGLSRMGIFLQPVKTAEDALTASHQKAAEAVAAHNRQLSAMHLSLAVYGEHLKPVTAAQREQAKNQDILATKTQGLATLQREFGGAAEKYSKTSAGAINNLKNTVDILAVHLGEMLLPIISAVAGVLATFVRQMMTGHGVGGMLVSTLKVLVDLLKFLFGILKDIWPVLAGLVAVWVAYNAQLIITNAVMDILKSQFVVQMAMAVAMNGVMGGVTAAWEAFNLVVAANPLLFTVLAIAAIVAALILAYKHIRWFRDFVNSAFQDVVAAFNWVKNAAIDVFDFIKGHWYLLAGLLFGPFGLAIGWIIEHWDTVKKLPGELLKVIKDIGGDIFHALTWPFRKAFEWVKHHLPSFHVHHIGPIPIPLPSFPGLAAGGIVPYSGAFVVGERGPELVTLPQGANVSTQNDLAQTNALLRELIAAVMQNSQALIVDGKVLAQAVNRQGLLQAARS